MYAVMITKPGGPEVLAWCRVPDPVAGPGEVLIDIHASAVNRADLLQRAGHYPPPPGAPPYPGLECSGVVAATGEGVTGLVIGDEVAALLAGGGYAERVAVPAELVLPVPRGVALADAASLPEVACTVWANVVDRAGMRSRC
jgi:NADPH:quinone reductase-like Zn-dependent oxidoreductase